MTVFSFREKDMYKNSDSPAEFRIFAKEDLL